MVKINTALNCFYSRIAELEINTEVVRGRNINDIRVLSKKGHQHLPINECFIAETARTEEPLFK